MREIAVIGGGPAGMMAAVSAATEAKDARITLYERGEKLGKKLYLTGKGRCNVTNDAPMEEFFANVPRNPKFLHSAFAALSGADLMDFFVERGLALKTERGGRVFPRSDKASDVTRILEGELRRLGVKVVLGTRVAGLWMRDDALRGLIVDGREVAADAVIIATGGLSYPSTGSTGDGYDFAASAGHAIVTARPSLVRLGLEESWPGTLAGLTLKNVELIGKKGKRGVFRERGELLFTHNGISGPLALSLSALLPEDITDLRAYIDIKPALSEETLDARILRDIEANPNKSLQNALAGLAPRALWDKIIDINGFPADIPAHQINRALRRDIAVALKRIDITIVGTGDMEEAIITRGGVRVRDIHPGTLASKRLPGLYFAGEVIDVDALTGGYNLQIAFSTGYLAGKSAAAQ